MSDHGDNSMSRCQQKREDRRSPRGYLEGALNLGPAQPQRFVAWAFLPRHRTLPRLKGYHQLPLCGIWISSGFSPTLQKAEAIPGLVSGSTPSKGRKS